MTKKKQGAFGTIHSEYSKKSQQAVDYFLKVKEGKIPNAIFHKSIGWIDLVWGTPGTKRSDGFGLSKIAKYHKSILPNLQKVLKNMNITFVSEGRIKLEDEKYLFSISRFYFEKEKKWLLTAYKKET